MGKTLSLGVKAVIEKLRIVLMALLLSAGVAHAKVEIVEFDNASQRELYQTLIYQLRCLVCQNQNLADSNADLAVDLRRKVRVLIDEGKDYDDIVEYMVSRYGEFVMYRPLFNTSTLFLWLSPAVLLVATFAIVFLRRRRKSVQTVSDVSDVSDFDASQHEKVRALLQDRNE